MEPAASQEFRIAGIPASPGLARGPLLVIEQGETLVPHYSITEEQIPHEIERFHVAIRRTKEQLLRIQSEVSENIGEKDAEIFEAHLLVLEDSTLLNAVSKQLRLKKCNIESVYQHVLNHYIEAISSLDDPYLSERAVDIQDVARRVLSNFTEKGDSPFALIKEPCIIVANDLTPSDTAQLPRDLVLGFVTRIGSKTSHSAIMARAMDIPAIVGLESNAQGLENGQEAVLDGIHGVLIINPTLETLESFGAAETRHDEVILGLERLRETLAVTRDDRHITLSANIELMSDLPAVLESGAEGIGLFRTEFLYANRNHLPTEEEQYQAYITAARAVSPERVILRTLDIGGDKLMSSYADKDEANPFLGMRAIRLCLAHPELFRTQLRAMLRATTEGNVAIMYPMISGVGELLIANNMLREEREKLRAEGHSIPDQFEVGAMIEIPSAALTAHTLAREVDFFSIGSNDLIQYSIAIDRGNQKLAHLYQPTHPAILQLIKFVIDAAHANKIWVGLCGEMASEFMIAPLLVGMGIDELSAGAAQVPRIKRVIQSVSYAEMKTLADEMMTLESGDEIMRHLDALARERFPELFD